MATRIIGASSPYVLAYVTTVGRVVLVSCPTLAKASAAVRRLGQKGLRMADVVKAPSRPGVAPLRWVVRFNRGVAILVSAKAAGVEALPVKSAANLEVRRLAQGITGMPLLDHRHPAYKAAAARWNEIQASRSDVQAFQQGMEQHAVAQDLVGPFEKVSLKSLRERARDLKLKGYSRLSKTALFALVGQAELAQADAARMEQLGNEADRILDAAHVVDEPFNVATGDDFGDFPF